MLFFIRWLQKLTSTAKNINTFILGHFSLSYALFYFFDPPLVFSFVRFIYFYIVTVTTVGYGDILPGNDISRFIAAFWLIPGGIIIFTAFISKLIEYINIQWRKKMTGLCSYSALNHHIVIIGWKGRETEDLIKQIYSDSSAHQQDIILCADNIDENPMVDYIKFIKGSLSLPGTLERAGISNADIIVVYGDNDHETLTAALSAAAINRTAHLVAHFNEESVANVLTSHCPNAECSISQVTRLLARCAKDPGSSKVQSTLLSVLDGPTQFSFIIPESVKGLTYGKLFFELKETLNATLIALDKDGVNGEIMMNADNDIKINPGDSIYYIANDRIESIPDFFQSYTL